MEQPKLYNFSDLTPEIQRWLYRRIYAFDLATRDLAAGGEDIISPIRQVIFLKVAQNMEADDRLNISHLEAIAADHDLPRGAFNGLTPAARWTSLLWIRAIDAAINDLWSIDELYTRLETEYVLFLKTDKAMADNTPEEIACYWNFVDRWEPRTPGQVNFDGYSSLYTEDVA